MKSREDRQEGRGARERRFKGKKKEVAFKKKKKKEHGEPVAASIRQLGAQLQPGAVTSRELHGKPSQFTSNNGVTPRVVFIGDLMCLRAPCAGARICMHTPRFQELLNAVHIHICMHIEISAGEFLPIARPANTLRKRGHRLLYR